MGKNIISMYDNINPISTEAPICLRICNTYFIEITINVIPKA